MPIRQKKAVFFDAGFTLLEPTVPVAEVYWRKAECLNAAVDREQFSRHFASQWRTVLHAHRSAHPQLHSSDALEREAWKLVTLRMAEPFPELLAKHEQWLCSLETHFDKPDSWKLRPAVSELLGELRDRGQTVGIVSNWHSALHKIVGGHNLGGLVSFVLTSAEVGRKKPHRRMFEAALQSAEARACEAIHVGDSWEDDVQGARAVGIDAVYLGSKPAEELEDGVTAVSCLSELLFAPAGTETV